MMVIYLSVKFEFDWTKRFRVRDRKQKCGQTDGRTNKRTELHHFRKRNLTIGTSSSRSLLSRYREQNSGRYHGIIAKLISTFQLHIFNSNHFKTSKIS